MANEKFDYERELLRWEEYMLKLRKKYCSTPAGFKNSKVEAAAVRTYEESCARFRKSRSHQIARNYTPVEEPFAGRETYLTLMRQMLDSHSGPVILYGIGGVGKSALAREYIRRNKNCYDCVLVLTYRHSLQDVICDDGQVPITNMRYSCDTYKSKISYFREKLRVLKEIAETGRILLLFDDLNAEKDKNLHAVFSLPCDILVTTRINPDLWGQKENRQIHVMGLRDKSEKEDFFRIFASGNKSLNVEQKNLLLSCCEETDWHPLDMIFRIREMFELPSVYPSEKKYFLADIFRRFSLSQKEKQIIRELCIMPVQGIPISLYIQLSGASREHINRLTEYLLIQKVWTSEGEEEMLSMHPLIAEAALKIFLPDSKNCQKLLWGMYDCIYDAWLKTYTENQRVEPYVLALLTAFSRPRGWLMKPLEAMVTFLWIQGYSKEARAYVLKLMDSVEKRYGEKHQNTGEMALRVAAVFFNTMDYERANYWYFKGYEILRVCRRENIAYYHIFSRACEKLAQVYSSGGLYKNALMFFDMAYENEVLFEEASGGRAYYAEHDSAICKAYCQLGKVRVLLDMDKIQEADRLYHQINLEASGFYQNDFHGHEARSVQVLLMVKKGMYEEALKCCDSLLKRTCKYRGNSSKETLEVREQFADICVLRGELANAVMEYGQVLEQLMEKYSGQKEWIKRILGKMNRI